MSAQGKFILILIGAMAASDVKAEPNGRAETSPPGNVISAVNRTVNDRASLVLRKNNADLLTISDTPQGIIPKLQDAYLQGNQLAVVVDCDLNFRYQLYALQNNSWVLLKDVTFNTMNLARRQRLLLVQMSDVTHVKIINNSGGADLFRKKGIVKEGDPQDIFEFGSNTTLKNGAVYNYNNGRE